LGKKKKEKKSKRSKDVEAETWTEGKRLKKSKTSSDFSSAEDEEGVINNEDPSSFNNYCLSPSTIRNLEKKGIKTLFPIQQCCFNHIYEGKDLVGRARTGTGKTLAFSLPIIERLEPSHEYGRKARVLVLTPTRELAKQVAEDFISIGTFLKTLCIYGGVPYEPQETALRKGVDVVVGTPGRILDHIERKTLILDNLKFICLDEADQMLDIGFKDSMEAILKVAAPYGNKEKTYQMLLFSATLPTWVHKTTQKYMNIDKVTVDLVKDEVQKTSTLIEHVAIRCPYYAREKAIRDVIMVYSGKKGRTIIFVSTKREANQLNSSSVLNQECQPLHGDIPQAQREATMKGFRDGQFRVLIATDVAARGLDIANVDVVINCEPPKDSDTYVHRSGRTGRAGQRGLCVTFYKSNQEGAIKLIEKQTGTILKRISAPQPADLMKAISNETKKALESVSESIIPHFEETARELIDTYGPLKSLASALAVISGYTELKNRSLLNAAEGFITYIMTCSREFRTLGYIRTILERNIDPTLKNEAKGMKMSVDHKSAVFDVPENIHKLIQEIWCDTADCTLKVAATLPELIYQESNFENGNGCTRNYTPWRRINGQKKSGGNNYFKKGKTFSRDPSRRGFQRS
jgi:ATP-dependent RNA helicase DDX21